MKRWVLTLALVSLTAAAATGLSALTLAPALGDFSFALCAAGGSSAQTLTAAQAGNYLMRVTAADVTMCLASTCAAGGQAWPTGTIIYLTLPAGPVSCRSAASLGNLYLTRAQ